MKVLTKEIVHEICSLLEEDKLSATEISAKLNLQEVSNNPISLISAIRKRKIWNNISSYYSIPLGAHNRAFNDYQIHRICAMLEHNPYTCVEFILHELGIEYDDSNIQQYRNTVSNIKTGRRYTYISEQYNIQNI